MITQYTFEDSEGAEEAFATFNCREAKDHAFRHNLKCFANEYEYSDRDLAWDFTTEDTDEDAETFVPTMEELEEKWTNT